MFGRVLILSVFLGVASLSLAQVGTVYSTQDLKAAVAAANSVLSSSTFTPRDAFLATVVLKEAKETAKSSSSACKSLQAVVESDAAMITDLSYALRALDGLGCLKSVSTGTVTKVQGGLESGKVGDVWAASTLLPLLQAHKQELTVSWPTIVDAISELVEEDGKFRDSQSRTAQSSALNAGYAYAILATAWPHVQGSPSAARVTATAQTVSELLQDAIGTEPTTLELAGGDDNLYTTAMVWAGVSALASVLGDKADIVPPAAEVAGFTRYFLSQAGSGDVNTAASVLIGLRGVVKSGAAPLSVRVLESALPESSKTPLTIAVTDVFGSRVIGDDATVTVKSVTRAGESSNLLSSPAKLTANTDGVFEYDLTSLKVGLGSYALTVAVNPASALYDNIDTYILTVKVLGVATVSTATLTVVDGDAKAGKAPIATTTATFPNKAKDTLSVGGPQLQVSFDVKSGTGSPLTPHQAFVRISGTTLSKPSVYIATSEGAGSYRVTIDTSNREALKSITTAGTYDVEVIVGDAAFQKAIVWKIGSVTITPPAPLPTPDEVLYTKPLLHDSDVTFKALPVIEHQFRQPDTRAPAIVSTTFTLAVAAPLLFLVVAAFAFGGANLKRVAEVNFIALLGFVGSLGSLLGLLVWYWLALNMFEVLAYLTIPAITCIIFGHSVLRALHTSTVTANKPKKD